MRNIFKFKVWSYEEGSFLESYGGKGELFLRDGRWVDVGWFMQCQRCEQSQRFRVLQFTGIVDKRGREICEGDLVDFDAVPMNAPYSAQRYSGFDVRYSSLHGAFVFGRDELNFCVGDGVKTESIEISGNQFGKDAETGPAVQSNPDGILNPSPTSL